MKIAFILPSLIQQGPVIVAHDLIIGLQRLGHSCQVFYFDKKSEMILDFPCLTQQISFYKKINFDEFDIVHSHGLRPDAYIFLHKPIKTSTHFVTTIHNFVLKDFSAQYNRLLALILGNLWMFLLLRHDLCVVLSKTAVAYYKRWLNNKRLTYVYNSRNLDISKELSEDEINKIIQFKGESVLLGINALLSPIKGVDMVIRALRNLPLCKLFIVGDGESMLDLKNLAKSLNVDEHVYFAGRKSEAYRYLPYYDLYLMPSRSEGFPLALLEAVAMKKNIVCSDIPVLKEIFSDDEVTFFNLENVKSLVDAIKYALKHNKAEKAYIRYINNYSMKCFADNYIRVYQGLKNK